MVTYNVSKSFPPKTKIGRLPYRFGNRNNGIYTAGFDQVSEYLNVMRHKFFLPYRNATILPTHCHRWRQHAAIRIAGL
jgi:hypothetical protein